MLHAIILSTTFIPRLEAALWIKPIGGRSGMYGSQSQLTDGLAGSLPCIRLATFARNTLFNLLRPSSFICKLLCKRPPPQLLLFMPCLTQPSSFLSPLLFFLPGGFTCRVSACLSLSTQGQLWVKGRTLPVVMWKGRMICSPWSEALHGGI